TIAQSLDPRSRPGTCAPFLHPWRWKRLFPPLVEVKCQISSTGGELDTATTANHRPEPCFRTETRPAGTTSPPMAMETTFASTGGDEAPDQLHGCRNRHGSRSRRLKPQFPGLTRVICNAASSRGASHRPTASLR